MNEADRGADVTPPPPSLQIDHTLRNRQTRPVPELDLLRGRHVGGQKTHKQRGHGLIKEEASLLKIHAPKQQINPGEFSSFVGRIDSSLKQLHERLSLGRPAPAPPQHSLILTVHLHQGAQRNALLSHENVKVRKIKKHHFEFEAELSRMEQRTPTTQLSPTSTLEVQNIWDA